MIYLLYILLQLYKILQFNIDLITFEAVMQQLYQNFVIVITRIK
jgi:hypothetical protein